MAVQKIFKNGQEKNKMKALVTWIEETYDDVSEYDIFIKTLNNDTDRLIMNLFEEYRLNDDDKKLKPEEIFNSMIPSLMNHDFNMEESMLLKLQQRTEQAFAEVVADSVKGKNEMLDLSKYKEDDKSDTEVDDDKEEKIEEEEKEELDHDEEFYTSANHNPLCSLPEFVIPSLRETLGMD